MLGKTAHDMFVDVTIGVPDPSAVDTKAVAAELLVPLNMTLEGTSVVPLKAPE